LPAERTTAAQAASRRPRPRDGDRHRRRVRHAQRLRPDRAAPQGRARPRREAADPHRRLPRRHGPGRAAPAARPENPEGSFGCIERRVFECGPARSFHPKAYVFTTLPGSGWLTSAARTSPARRSPTASSGTTACSRPRTGWDSPRSESPSRPSSVTGVPAARRRLDHSLRAAPAATLPSRAAAPVEVADEPFEAPEPTIVQIEALAALEATRQAGNSAASSSSGPAWARRTWPHSTAAGRSTPACSSSPTAKRSSPRPCGPSA